ncbi:hypothetical protein GALL_161560 [mine drainage metagenome]|uniref:Transmembrane protein n=1 Tax=mine drainage metagenome TaxID=410659 RepID=A0A1J5SP60_9ZZZZ
MTAAPQDFSLFEAVSGTIVFVSFVVFVFMVATLRNCVDEEKIRKEENVSSLFQSPIPPERILTAVGKRRMKAAKIALAIFCTTTAAIIIRVQIFQK